MQANAVPLVASASELHANGDLYASSRSDLRGGWRAQGIVATRRHAPTAISRLAAWIGSSPSPQQPESDGQADGSRSPLPVVDGDAVIAVDQPGHGSQSLSTSEVRMSEHLPLGALGRPVRPAILDKHGNSFDSFGSISWAPNPEHGLQALPLWLLMGFFIVLGVWRRSSLRCSLRCLSSFLPASGTRSPLD